jgi:hypothetical protein
MYKEMDNGYIPSVFQEKQTFTKEDFLDGKTFEIGINGKFEFSKKHIFFLCW